MLQANNDFRLVKAFDEISTGKVKVLSVDIFDTLIWRKVPVPTDLFLMVAERFKKEGLLTQAINIEGFADLRVKGENLARFQKRQILHQDIVEITLKEIYWQLSGVFKHITLEQMIKGEKGLYDEADVSDFVDVEVEFESCLTEYDYNIVNLIRYAVSKNVKVILVSNTYFENDQMERILNKPHINYAKDIQSLISAKYLSCEYGCSKQNGLFAIILKELNLKPTEILHIGDSQIQDCLAAQQEGISTLYLPKNEKGFEKILEREVSQDNLYARRKALDPVQGDFGLTAIRSEMEFHTDLEKVKPNNRFYWKYGATVLGPVLTGFVNRIYTRCEELEQSKVFCLMREGRLYANLINEFAPYYPSHKITPYEMWISRPFIMHTCTFNVDVHEIKFLLYSHPVFSHPTSRFTIEKFCDFLGLDITKIPHLKKMRHMKLDEADLCEDVAHYLAKHDALREQILKRGQEKRRNYLKYLNTLVDLKTLDKMVLVDVGWAGTAQACLQMIFKLEGYPIEVQGLYLGTKHAIDMGLLHGRIREGYLMQMGYPYGTEKAIKQGFYILEQSAIGNLGQFKDVDENQNIITHKPLASKKQMEYVDVIQQGIRAYCHKLGAYIQSGAVKLDSYSDGLKEQLRLILVRATSYLTRQEAQRFGKWTMDFQKKKVSSLHMLANDKYYENHIENMLPDLPWEDRGMNWPFAYAAKKSQTLAKVAQARALKLVPSDCFLSIDAFPMKIYIDNGKGFSKKPTKVVELRSNANRSFYGFTKVLSLKHPIKRIRIDLGVRSAILQVKTLRLTTYHKSHTSPSHYFFFEGDEQEQSLILEGGKEIEKNTFQTKDGFSMTYDFNSEDIYLAQVNLCFGSLFFE